MCSKWETFSMFLKIKLNYFIPFLAKSIAVPDFIPFQTMYITEPDFITVPAMSIAVPTNWLLTNTCFSL